MKIRTGKEVKNKQELQNLIVAILNRQQHPYEKGYIVKAVKYYLKGSIYLKSKETVEMIDENLDFMYRKGLIDCRLGIFYPRVVGRGFFKYQDNKIQRATT